MRRKVYRSLLFRKKLFCPKIIWIRIRILSAAPKPGDKKYEKPDPNHLLSVNGKSLNIFFFFWGSSGGRHRICPQVQGRRWCELLTVRRRSRQSGPGKSLVCLLYSDMMAAISICTLCTAIGHDQWVLISPTEEQIWGQVELLLPTVRRYRGILLDICMAMRLRSLSHLYSVLNYDHCCQLYGGCWPFFTR